MDYKIQKIDQHGDKRGKLVVFLKNSDLSSRNNVFGQIYFVTFTSKGIIRGNHYHKKWREWFSVVEGKLEVKLEDVKTKERAIFILNSDDKSYVRLEIGPLIAHSFKSLTGHVSLLNYTNKEWSAQDTFPYKLI